MNWKLKVEIYRCKWASIWRWRAKARNGKILADSGEGYNRRKDCVSGWFMVRPGPVDASSGDGDHVEFYYY